MCLLYLLFIYSFALLYLHHNIITMHTMQTMLADKIIRRIYQYLLKTETI